MIERKVFVGILIGLVVLVGGVVLFSNNDSYKEERTSEPDSIEDGEKQGNVEEKEESKGLNWRESELTDVNTGKSFKISDFSEKPVLVESFAVWCPTCTRQQRIIKEFHEEVGDSVVSISLDTDPNEDEERVRKHTEENGFDWIYAVSPSSVTQSLIEEFGVGIVNAPSVPMILICPDGSAKKLSNGIKDVDELKSEIQGCGD